MNSEKIQTIIKFVAYRLESATHRHARHLTKEAFKDVEFWQGVYADVMNYAWRLN